MKFLEFMFYFVSAVNMLALVGASSCYALLKRRQARIVRNRRHLKLVYSAPVEQAPERTLDAVGEGT